MAGANSTTRVAAPVTKPLGAPDELTLCGGIAALAWVLISIEWTRTGGWTQLLWLCDVATLGTAIGLISRSPLILTAELTGTVFCHLGWHVDFLSYLLTGRMPFQATEYMFGGQVGAYGKALSFFQHTFILYVCIVGVRRLGAARRGWIFQTFQTAAAILLTYLFTKPSENINWIFGAGFPGLSPAARDPGVYYLLIVLLSPIVIYLPINLVAARLAPKRPMQRIQVRRACAVVVAVAVVSAGIGAAAGYAFRPAPFPNSLIELTSQSPTRLEKVPVDNGSPRVESIQYGVLDQRQPIELHVRREPLPRMRGEGGLPGWLSLRDLGLSGEFHHLPRAPQGVVVKGTRGRRGTVVCAVVGADQFYLQPWCDTQTALDRFEIHCRFGEEGLQEFVVPGEGIRKPPGVNQVIIGGALQSIYVLSVVGFDRNTASRSPFYSVRRTGVWRPDDVVWSQRQDIWSAALR